MFVSDRRWRVAALGGVVLTLGACTDDGTSQPGRWTSHGGNLANQRNGMGNDAISPDSVAGLTEAWRVTPASVVGTPAVFDGVVYFGAMDKQVHAVDIATHQELWATPITGGVQSSLAVSDTSVYAIDIGAEGRAFDADAEPPQVYRLDRQTGEIKAQADYDVHAMSVGWSSPVHIPGDNLLVFGVASFEVFLPGPRSFRGKVRALDGDTLAEKWTFEVVPAEFGVGVSVWSSPAVDTELGMIYIGTGQGYEHPVTPMSDALLAIDYHTGEKAWHKQYTAEDTYVLFGQSDGNDYDVGAPPTLFTMADGTLAVGVGDKEGSFHVHNRRNGGELWNTKLTNGSSLGGVMQSAAFYDGEIFVNSNKGQGGDPSLFCLDANTGDIVWDTDLGEAQVFGATTVVNGVVIFGDMQGTVHVRSAADGSVIWTDPHVPATDQGQLDAEAIAAGISVVDGMLFVPFGAQAFPTSYFTGTGDPLGGGLAAYKVE